MTQVVIELAGRNRIEEDFRAFPQKAKAVYGEAVGRAGATLRDETKKLPPVSATRTGYQARGIPVDTGRMRQSLSSKKLSLLAAGVMTNTNYGGYVHEGTIRMPSRPFFEWSLEMGAQRKIDDIFASAATLLP